MGTVKGQLWEFICGAGAVPLSIVKKIYACEKISHTKHQKKKKKFHLKNLKESM